MQDVPGILPREPTSDEVAGNVPMRIAIDAQFLDLPSSGIGAYVRNLIGALPSVLGDDTLVPLVRADVPHLPGVLGGDPRVRRGWWEIAGVGSAAATRGADLLHVPSFAAPLRTTIPVVVTIHDAIPFLLPAYRASMAMRAHLALMRRTTARARLVLTPSAAAADDLERMLGISRRRIRITPLAADPGCRPPTSADAAALAAARARFGLAGSYVFSAAGLDVRKRVDLLLEAFAAAREMLPMGTQLVLAGSAHTNNAHVYPQYMAIVRRLRLEGRVVFTGWIDEPTKIALYQGAAAAVTASIAEGFGLTVLEGMACGAPVIATARTSLPEVAGDAALLVEPTVVAWRDALVRALGDSSLAEDLRGRGLVRAAGFSWERTAAATAAVYHEALEQGGRT